jgi:hypothetical protein
MSNSRRSFLQSGAALAAGLTGTASAIAAQPDMQALGQSAAAGKATSEIEVPQMKFFHTTISRLVLGVNPFYGFAHYNGILAKTMKEWYTPDRVCSVMHQCIRFGINTMNYVHLDRGPEDLARFQAEGGKMQLIIQVTSKADAEMLVKTLKPLALQRQGEVVDDAWQSGKMETVKEWCKKARDLGVLVGVGTHIPEVIAYVEEKGWDVDFFSGCVYNRRRTADEQKQVLNGESIEMPNELYLKSDPARMYRVIRQTRKPCFAFKILAAGRVPDNGIEQAFRTAFESIKPTDAVYVGMFPKFKDEVRENAEIVNRILMRS